jgi:hypothetical protein
MINSKIDSVSIKCLDEKESRVRDRIIKKAFLRRPK